MSFFRGFDAFSKSKKHVLVKTTAGASISLVAAVIMVLLFFSELVYWRTTRIEDHILVDKTLGDRDVDIDLELHFHALSCSGAPGCGRAAPPERAQCLLTPPLPRPRLDLSRRGQPHL